MQMPAVLFLDLNFTKINQQILTKSQQRTVDKFGKYFRYLDLWTHNLETGA